MATSTGQRIGIWIIAGAMIIGTLAGFIAMILAPQNEAKDAEKLEKAIATYQKQTTDYQTQTAAQDADVKKRTDALSKKYYGTFADMKPQVKKFDAKSATKLVSTDLKTGKGESIGDKTTYLAYYIGFNPDGKIFDSSFEKSSLKSPLIARPDPGSLITGWQEGMKGKKIGGIYKLVIPSDKAYGKEGKGEDIKPNTPLTFIVMPIEVIKTINQPQIPKELLG